jgi:hypothetical protein
MKGRSQVNVGFLSLETDGSCMRVNGKDNIFKSLSTGYGSM